MNVAYQYCTGRVDIYINDAPVSPNQTAYTGESALNPSQLANAARYLGTCEQYPLVNGGQNWNPWFADQTGNMEPADWEYQNEWKVLVLNLNKFKQGAVDRISNFGYTTSTGKSGIGKLLQGNKNFFCTWLRFYNFFHNDYNPPGLPPGEFYPCCRLVTSKYGPLGTLSRTVPLVIRTCPLLTLTSIPGGTNNNTTLTYSTDEKWFTGLPKPDSLDP